MKIIHNKETKRAFIEIESYTAYVEYEISDGALEVLHTYVPSSLNGQGIASQLVQYIYEFAREQRLKPTASCSYAKAWLNKHPEYSKE